jgi:hypothetical protein
MHPQRRLMIMTRMNCMTLDRECSKIPKYDILVLLGDLNAKVGKEDFL